jgi:acyl-CoA synthetase (AMP-forming)/AMP-acid ligase II
MLPKYIELRDELPKNNSGKIDKKALSAEGIALRAEG